MPTERQLWKWLSDGRLPLGHYSRIESDTSQGFPDVNYCINGIEGNIELKVSRKPKAKLPFKIGGLRDSQIRWIGERLSHKGRVWIIAQVGIERFVLSGVWAGRFNGLNLSKLRTFAQYQFPRGGHSSAMLRIILRE